MKLKKFIKFYAYVTGLSFYIVFCIAFLMAYFHESKAITIWINLYHEASIEFFVVIISIISVIFALFWDYFDVLEIFEIPYVHEDLAVNP